MRVPDEVHSTRCPALGNTPGVHPESSRVEGEPAQGVMQAMPRRATLELGARSSTTHIRESLPANRRATEPGARLSQCRIGTTALPTMPGPRGRVKGQRGLRAGAMHTCVEPAPQTVESGLVLEVDLCGGEASEDHAGVHDAVHVCTGSPRGRVILRAAPIRRGAGRTAGEGEAVEAVVEAWEEAAPDHEAYAYEVQLE